MELSTSAKRVQDFLSAKGFSFEVQELPGSTRTAREAADRVGCAVSQIAKSLVFKEKKTDRPILVIASGANRVDLKKNPKIHRPETRQSGREFRQGKGRICHRRSAPGRA